MEESGRERTLIAWKWVTINVMVQSRGQTFNCSFVCLIKQRNSLHMINDNRMNEYLNDLIFVEYYKTKINSTKKMQSNDSMNKLMELN